MKATALELDLHRWPYGLEIRPSPNGLLLRPRRKARTTWRKAFRGSLPHSDELASTRGLANVFDRKGWEW